MSGSRRPSGRGKGQGRATRKAYMDARRSLDSTTRQMSRANMVDDNNDQHSSATATTPKQITVDLNDVPVILCFVVGDYPYPNSPIPDIMVSEVVLGQVSTEEKVRKALQATTGTMEPLQEIYGLSLVDHKQILIAFTDGRGQRCIMPLFRFNNPFFDGDTYNLGKVASQWKCDVESGKLEHNPKCYCTILPGIQDHVGLRHGVEIIQILRTKSCIAKLPQMYYDKQMLETECEMLKKELKKELKKLTIAGGIGADEGETDTEEDTIVADTVNDEDMTESESEVQSEENEDDDGNDHDYEEGEETTDSEIN